MPGYVINRQKARDNFVDEKNTQFDYTMFHYSLGLHAYKVDKSFFAMYPLIIRHSLYRIRYNLYHINPYESVVRYFYGISCMESIVLIFHWLLL